MSVGTGVSKSSFQWMNVANETHTALGRTLAVQIRCQAFRTQDKPLDTVHLVLKTDRETEAGNGHNTHLVSESLFGATLTRPCRRPLWRGPHLRQEMRSSAGDTARGPGTEVRRDTWFPGRRGKGWQFPELPP